MIQLDGHVAGQVQKDRRGERRFLVAWPLVAGHRHLGSMRGHVINVSLGGLLFRSTLPYSIGELVEVEISPVPERCIRAVITVQRMECVSHGDYLYAGRFVRFEDRQREMLEDCLLAILSAGEIQSCGCGAAMGELEAGQTPARPASPTSGSPDRLPARARRLF